MIFESREQAGYLLAKRLRQRADRKTVVIGIVRGGVVVAFKIASILHLPLDILVIRKIGAPQNPELAIGAVGPEETVFWEDSVLESLNLSGQEKEALKEAKSKERSLKEISLRGNKNPLPLANKTVILVDDGVATGATVITAILYLRKKKVKKAILAVPVIARDSLAKIKKYFDEVIYLEAPTAFYAVGEFYKDFPQVEDEEVIEQLEHRA